MALSLGLFLADDEERRAAGEGTRPGDDFRSAWCLLLLVLQSAALLSDPRGHVPDRAANAVLGGLYATLARERGPVLCPAHPFYPVLAAKPSCYHEMSLWEVIRYDGPAPAGLKDLVDELGRRVATGYYAAIVTADDEDGQHFRQRPVLFSSAYFQSDRLPPSTIEALLEPVGRPHAPAIVWRHRMTAVPPFDDIVDGQFDGDRYRGWRTYGDAFGRGPTDSTPAGHPEVFGRQGRGHVDSTARGINGTGMLESSEFPLRGTRVSFLVGGRWPTPGERVELVVDGTVVRRTVAAEGLHLVRQVWDVTEFKGQPAILRVFDVSLQGGVIVDDFQQYDIDR